MKFPTHFQISASEINLAYGFYGIIRAFGWRNVGIITQDENLFTVVWNFSSLNLSLVINPIITLISDPEIPQG